MSLNLRCNGCGGEIEYEAGSQSLKCPYCGAINEIAKPEDKVPDNVEKIIPLTVKKEDLENRVYEYMASGDYTPDDMIDEAKIISRQFLYVPTYKFQVEFEATWTASFGYDRTEHYTEYVTVTRNGHSVKEPRTKTKTVTDWRPANGTDAGRFSVAAYAGKKLNESGLHPADIVKFTATKGEMTDFNPSFLQGVETENFTISESSSFASLKNEINSVIERSVKSHGQGDRQKDWHWSATMAHSSKTVYVPICHAVFDYKGAEYQVWIDGIGTNEIRADALPEDKEKKQEVNKGFIPMAVGMAGLLATSYFWEFTWAAFGWVAAVGGYGFMRRNALIGYSKKIRESLLTQMKASSITMNDLSDEDRSKYAKAFQHPEKPFFAKIHRDKIVLPILSSLALIGVSVSDYNAYENTILASSTEMAAPAAEVSEAPVAESPTVEMAAPAATPVVEPATEATNEMQNSGNFDSSIAKLSDGEYLEIKKMSPEYGSADAELGKTFSMVRKMLSPEQKEQLKLDEMNWIESRDQQLQGMGKKGSQEYINSLIQLTQERTQFLKNYQP
jgi:LSD1 subclass zinc finger protein